MPARYHGIKRVKFVRIPKPKFGPKTHRRRKVDMMRARKRR
jgi:hypothetical protein